MTRGLFNDYVERLDAVSAERLLDMADAALYGQLTRESGKKWRDAVVRRITRAVDDRRPSDTPHRRTSLFFWGGQAIEPAALKHNLAGSLGYRFRRD
jgi:hypothetical protein